VLLLTEWDQFVSLDPTDAATVVADRVIIDGRNALDPVTWRRAGWTYAGVGR
jgi:UDP-glucose 6-dehydrogenase